jgi:nucleotide-binding universal stress UspA family protein
MPLQRVLVGYDGTEHSERALQFVVGMNDDYETEIHLAFIVNEPAGMADPIPDEVLDSLQKKGLDSLANAERLVRKRFHKPVTHLEIGNPVDRLLELADKLNPQLVVLGITKHSASESLIGTVSSQFLRSRRYPILLVP